MLCFLAHRLFRNMYVCAHESWSIYQIPAIAELTFVKAFCHEPNTNKNKTKNNNWQNMMQVFKSVVTSLGNSWPLCLVVLHLTILKLFSFLFFETLCLCFPCHLGLLQLVVLQPLKISPRMGLGMHERWRTFQQQGPSQLFWSEVTY